MPEAMHSESSSSSPQAQPVPDWCRGSSRPRVTGRKIWQQPDFTFPVGKGCTACAKRRRTCYVRADRKSCASCTAQGNSRGLCDIACLKPPVVTKTASTPTQDTSPYVPG